MIRYLIIYICTRLKKNEQIEIWNALQNATDEFCPAKERIGLHISHYRPKVCKREQPEPVKYSVIRDDMRHVLDSMTEKAKKSDTDQSQTIHCP